MRRGLLTACLFAGAHLAFLPAQAQQTLDTEALLGDLRARHIGTAMTSGRISTLDAVAKKPEIMYIGAAGGGIWKTISGGASFRPVFDDNTQSIGKIVIDQNHPDTVWVGTGEPWVRNSVSVGTGIYKTTNGGSTWERMGLENSERISDVLISAKDPNTVFVGVQGHLWNGNAERGVYKTTDGGKSWEKVLYIDENTGCADLDIDTKNPNIIYAAMWGHRRSPDFFDSGFGGKSGLYKTIDGGKSWQKINNGLPNETFETSFTLQYDEKAPYTAEGRDLLHKTTMQLYDMTQQLAYIYDALGRLHAPVKERSAQSTQLNKKHKAYGQEVEKLRNSLVSLEGDFYVDEGERLRERISELFLQISTYPGTPSQSQLERVAVLAADLAEVEKQYQALSSVKLQQVNQVLAKAKLDEVSMPTKQEFLNSKDNSGNGAGGELKPDHLLNLWRLN